MYKQNCFQENQLTNKSPSLNFISSNLANLDTQNYLANKSKTMKHQHLLSFQNDQFNQFSNNSNTNFDFNTNNLANQNPTLNCIKSHTINSSSKFQQKWNYKKFSFILLIFFILIFVFIMFGFYIKQMKLETRIYQMENFMNLVGDREMEEDKFLTNNNNQQLDKFKKWPTLNVSLICLFVNNCKNYLLFLNKNILN